MTLRLHVLTMLCLFFFCNPLKANESYNVSTLYLSIPAYYHAAEVNLSGQLMKKQGDVFIADGLAPGKYLLTVSQKQYFQPTIATNAESYKWILYSGYIQIAPKKVIFANVDIDRHYNIMGERPTKSVFSPHFLDLECEACLLQDS